jgi:leucyl-tRNA synthetase
MNQWYFKITDYKDRLIKNLDIIDYPKPTINAQRMWLENLHDWCVSRQRSWGCPIPVDGESDTLDTFVDSSFYYLRYLTDSDSEFLPKEDYRQVDLYVGGNEHACMHLIYARFITMFLYDIGFIDFEEPFKKVIHQGMILNNGEKMSKSKGNVVNLDSYDSDEIRFYLMFIGHYFDGGSWSDSGIVGIRRFINRIGVWFERTGEDTIDLNKFRKTIFDFTESFKFNKVVSSFMILLNENKNKNLYSLYHYVYQLMILPFCEDKTKEHLIYLILYPALV